MNAYHELASSELWHVAGWTMLHFLWLGAAVGVAAAVCRLALRRSPAQVRYVVAIGWLALVAALPIAVAAWLAAKPQAVGVPQAIDNTAAAGVLSNEGLELPAGDDAIRPNVADHSVMIVDAAGRPTLAVFALESCVAYLPWLWLIGTPLTFALLATGVVGAERLRRTSRPVTNGPVVEASARLRKTMRITRRVGVAVCERIAAPVLVGIVRPIILLPPAALTGWSPDEIEMVLLHELAHVRRWDNLVNLLQRIIESLLFFHPAVWWVSGWVRREREACCDAVVVGRTNRPHAYAEMLVALAAQMPRSVLFHPTASSAMAAGPLRTRIRRILQLEDDPMLVSGKSLALVMGGLLLVSTLVVLNLPTRGQAEESTTEDTESTEGKPDILGESLTKPGPTRDTKFPSLDEQKLADFVWKRLGLELESIGEDDLNRVQALGYDGGVKVSYGNHNLSGPGEYGQINFGDILVGLHVWPTTRLGNVVEVLGRPDLEKLTPLKFYVVRPITLRIDAEELGADAKDMIVTGRINVNLDAARSRQLLTDALETTRAATAAVKPQVAEVATGPAGRELLVQQTAANPAELDVLRQHVEILEAQVKRLDDLYKAGESTLEMRELAAYELAQSQGELELAAGRREQALGRFKEARANAEQALKAATKAYEAGQTSHDIVLEAMRNLSDIKLKLIHLQSTNLGAANEKPALRYDGKSFDQWRAAWRTELSTEKRLEAVKALAAFGRVGYGREAAEAILEVAGQYDWKSIIGNDTVAPLKQACISAFTGDKGTYGGELAHRIGPMESVPVLVQAADSANARVRQFLVHVLPYMDGPRAAEALVTLSRDSDASIRSYALHRLTPSNDALIKRLHEALRSDDPATQRAALIALSKTDGDKSFNLKMSFLADIEPLLFAAEKPNRQLARRFLSLLAVGDSSPRRIEQLAERMLDVLNADERTADHLAAIRALAVLKRRAKPAAQSLGRILASDNETTRVAAAAALYLCLGDREYQRILAETIGEKLGISIHPDHGFAIKAGGPYHEFQQRVNGEINSLWR